MASTWSTWVEDDYLACTGSSATTSSLIWTYWTDTGTAQTSSTTWKTWVYLSDRTTTSTYASPLVRAAPSAEERRFLEEERKRWAEREAQLVRERKAAEERAEALLLANLSLEQQSQFRRDRSFVVCGSNGRRYRIRHGRVANVDMVRPDGTVEHRLCAHPTQMVPDFDTMLAQKIMLEVKEEEFIRIANKHTVPNPGQRILPVLDMPIHLQ